ncbi:hypothetical protein [Cohnella candidum]|uniref:Uncharacterized protein n=1 Tax=Cohnella candidum TaxID=2674991 RepID=A0A3G3JV98_9BACL|nr:hypothetical protein [Cohnella candidum]AYQ72104.1 hypothetical protein EAV92_05680 [Cohnella candidum]
MAILLMIAGGLIFVLGIFIGIADESLIFILLSVIGGLLLIGLSKIIELLEGITHRSLGVPYTHDQIRTILQSSLEYPVEAEGIAPYPDSDTPYPLLHLDGETYMRARVFRNYLSQDGSLYTFAFPDRPPEVLRRMQGYYPGAELFAHEDQVYVKLSRIRLKPRVEGHKLILEFQNAND